MSDCIIPECVRSAETEYCGKHKAAFDNIEVEFSSWQKAYGKKFSYNMYLERLSEDYEIGSG